MNHDSFSVCITLFMVYNYSQPVPFSIKFCFCSSHQEVLLEMFSVSRSLWTSDSITQLFIFDIWTAMCMMVTVFCSMTPCSLVEKIKAFRGIYYLIFHPQYGAVFFSETSTDFFFQSTRRHIEDKSSIQYLRCFVDSSSWRRC